MRRKLTILMIYGILVSLPISAQQIIRQSLSCLGTNILSDGLLIRQTIGQPSNTSIVMTESGSLRQGFQQPLSINGARYYSETSIELTVFPNPTQQDFYMSILGEKEKYNYTITDVFGQILYSSSISNNQKEQIQTYNWATGIYFVNVYSERYLLATKKIIKTS